MQKPSTPSKKRTPKAIQNAAPVQDAPKKKAATRKPRSSSRTSSPAPKTLGAKPKPAAASGRPLSKHGKLREALAEVKASVRKVEKLMKL